MSELQNLLQEQEALQKRIAEARKEKKVEAIAQCRKLIDDFDLTESELFKGKRGKRTVAKVAPKYRDPQTGATWTGRGKAPRWIQNKNRDEFLIR